jgi:hypothetical protein
MLTPLEIRQKRQEIYRIANEHGAKNIRVFGSVVRNESDAESDIDFLVEFDDDRSLFDLIAMKNKLEKLFNRPVDIITEQSLHWSIREEVLQEAVEI